MATKSLKSAHVILLKIDHVDGKYFESDAALQKWLSACLNANTKHKSVKVEVSATLEPLVIPKPKPTPLKKVAVKKAGVKAVPNKKALAGVKKPSK